MIKTNHAIGSGKTAAYLIPIINKLMGKAKKLAAPRPNPAEIDAGVAAGVTAEPLVVIICPARELAVQIFNVARKFCYRTMLRPVVIYGGGPLKDQIYQLQRGCDILIASPGRLVDMMDRPSVLSLRRVRYMVVDEADEMLHSDWEEEFNKILSGGGKYQSVPGIVVHTQADFHDRTGGGKCQVYVVLCHLSHSDPKVGQGSPSRITPSNQCWTRRQLPRQY
jgi:hypothetical protein